MPSYNYTYVCVNANDLEGSPGALHLTF